jgi:protocatechuate 3,4-dioxygenase beta subunit
MTEPAQDSRLLISRRRSLAVIGSGSAALLLGRGAGSISDAYARGREGDDYVGYTTQACTLTAEQEEGPFYVAVDDVRDEIRLGQTGVPLTLRITIINSKTCKPIKYAAVDIWQCNASGVYSDVESEDTLGETYLRGVQFTDKHGQVVFNTIYPGHYAGRTTHIHARIHINSGDYDHKLVGGHVAHTGQMFPPDAVNAAVYKLSPYNEEIATVVTHSEDRVWTQQDGYEGLLTVNKLGHRLQKGLEASVTLAVDPSATPAPIGATSTAATVAGEA